MSKYNLTFENGQPSITIPEGLETLQDLEIEVFEEGTGKVVQSTDAVEVHYQGWLTDGDVFDSSYRRGESISFGLNQVIPGWTEGIAGQKVGSTLILAIPHHLAYGPQGAPGSIPPYSTLIFVVQVLGIK
jgi:FKBP-type peptidyl-prolyl cis-trans isomerase